MTTQPEPDSLRQRIAAVFRTKDGQLPAWTKRDAGPEAHVDAVLAVVQPVIDEAQQRAEQIAAITALAFDADLRPDVRLSRIRNLIDPADDPEGGAQ